LVIKSYADALINGFTLHGARVVATANVSALTGLPTTDGVTLIDGNCQLNVGQTTQSQNGPWIVHASAWTRPTWWAAAASISEGNYFIIDPDGTANKNTKWFVTNTGAITVDTTAVTFTQDLSGTSYVNGNGLNLAGTTFSVNPLTNGGITVAGGGVSVQANGTNLITVGASGVGISNSGGSGQIIVANGSSVPVWVAASGDVTVAAGGGMTVNNTAGSGFTKYTNFVANETPGGTINGSNAAFTLANTPQWLQLQLNGVTLEPGAGNDYTISAAAVTMLLIPQTGDKLRAYYTK
jgi:hypothetical protein